jgi:hypothetical protein
MNLHVSQFVLHCLQLPLRSRLLVAGDARSVLNVRHTVAAVDTVSTLRSPLAKARFLQRDYTL